MSKSARKTCWSCHNGQRDGTAQNNTKYKGCCKQCANHRTCATCGVFSDQQTLPWCVICDRRLARSCSTCHTRTELQLQLCTVCSRSSAISRRGHDFCWSCVAGGFGSDSSKRQFGTEYRNCCATCFKDRTCQGCQSFNGSKHVRWCSKCQLRVARWCSECVSNEDLDLAFCSACAEESSSFRTDSKLLSMRCLPRPCEAVRFGLDALPSTMHRITHMLVVSGGDGTSRLVTASSDRSLRLWDAQRGLFDRLSPLRQQCAQPHCGHIKTTVSAHLTSPSAPSNYATLPLPCDVMCCRAMRKRRQLRSSRRPVLTIRFAMLAEMLHASGIPNSPYRNNRQASCLGEGCAASCSAGVSYIRIATYASTLVARSLHPLSRARARRARYVGARG